MYSILLVDEEHGCSILCKHPTILQGRQKTLKAHHSYPELQYTDMESGLPGAGQVLWGPDSAYPRPNRRHCDGGSSRRGRSKLYLNSSADGVAGAFGEIMLAFFVDPGCWGYSQTLPIVVRVSLTNKVKDMDISLRKTVWFLLVVHCGCSHAWPSLLVSLTVTLV